MISRMRPRWRRGAIATMVASSALLAVVSLALAGWTLLPLPVRLAAPDEHASVRIEDRHGILLRSTRGSDGSRARWIPLSEMDPDLLLAFVAVEDRRFWERGGVDVRAVVRAARDNLRSRRIVSGASTITMQLARLLHPRDRGWSAKIREAAWALRLERHLTKQQILEQYLNRLHLGQATVGVSTASGLYFGAAASEVSVGEAALLAGLAHAPSRDNPLVSPARARARRDVALARMRRAGAVAQDEADRASAEPIVSRRNASPFLAPHFTTRLLERGVHQGATDGVGPTSVVRTTLDGALQRELEDEVRHAVDMLGERGVRHAAIVVLENRSGEVLAWIGSPDFWAESHGQTDMVVSPRQPGSALKPFLYALAFDRGTTAATVLPDVPRSYPTATGPYRPRNYDRRFRGPVRAREALASSYNVPAVELAERLGVGALLHTLHLAGFASLRRDGAHYGLGLALGNGDVTLLEIANGYRALANGGVWEDVSWVRGGRSATVSRRVVAEQSAALVLDILADPAARVPGFGLQTPFDFPFPAAVKTGTSRHFTDNWAVATTGGFTVAVWVGNFGGEPMQGVSGVTGAGPLLHRAVTLTARRYDPGVLVKPARAGLVAAEICRISGLLATAECPSLTEWFVPGTIPDRRDDWLRGGRIVLPAEYAEWAAQPSGMHSAIGEVGTERIVASGEVRTDDSGSQHATGDAPSIPGARDSAESAGLRIIAPLEGDVYRVPPGVPDAYASIPLRAAGVSGPITWSVNGTLHEGSRWRLTPGTHLIRAESGRSSAQVRIRVE